VPVAAAGLAATAVAVVAATPNWIGAFSIPLPIAARHGGATIDPATARRQQQKI